jgi:hypothetical protein
VREREIRYRERSGTERDEMKVRERLNEDKKKFKKKLMYK